METELGLSIKKLTEEEIDWFNNIDVIKPIKMETELERLAKLKEEAKKNRQKSKPCKECKKKKEVTKLPDLIHEEVYIPTAEEIGLAYAELTSSAGVKEDKKEFINNVFKALFGKDFDFKCRGCGNSEVRRFTNYVHANNINY